MFSHVLFVRLNFTLNLVAGRWCVCVLETPEVNAENVPPFELSLHWLWVQGLAFSVRFFSFFMIFMLLF